MRRSLVLLSAFLIFGFASCDNGTTNGVTNNWGNWVYSEWTVTTPATTDTEGVETRTRTRTCYNTGQVQTENQTRAIPATGSGNNNQQPGEYSIIGDWRATDGGGLFRLTFNDSTTVLYYWNYPVAAAWNAYLQFTWNTDNNILTLTGGVYSVTATFQLSQQVLVLSDVIINPDNPDRIHTLQRTWNRHNE